MSAGERRQEVLRAAAKAFAAAGYEATTTEEVAQRAGISQPYIFRLFGSKKQLFLAVVESCFARTVETFERAAEGLSGGAALEAMGMAYVKLIQDPTVLLVQMHAFTAAADDKDIRGVAQRGMRKVWDTGIVASGLGPDAVRGWLATGMLLNVVAALGLGDLDEPWAKELALKEEARRLC
jgi:AcrR family transcriptional regulator